MAVADYLGRDFPTRVGMDRCRVAAWGGMAASDGMDKVLEAIRQTSAFRKRAEQHAAATTPATMRHFAYLMRDEELWARAYAQFIATEAGDAALWGDIALCDHIDGFVWGDADFEPVADAVRALMRAAGWV